MTDSFKPLLAKVWPSSVESTPIEPMHPYFPASAEISGYLANEMSVPALLASFGVLVAVIWSGSYMIIKSYRPKLSTGELLTFLWFVLCGFIHFFFEGYFAFNFQRMGSRMDLFGQLWKEYAMSDSRYLTRNSFVLCMETITAIFWGPLSFFVAGLITRDHPLRHPFQMIVSLGQLYGDVLYYATCTFDDLIYGLQYSRPDGYYFWAYYIFMNTFWIIIPLILLTNSSKAVYNAFSALQKMDATLKKNPGKKRS